ncbi:geranylgeranyl diphosphate synthase type I [Nocardia transvalensis]|uniref:Geranylgeranyl diphosphate synthase type I n=1 Tax=Nocardia transvalensis TaxID=37333 RepID=A0A7W9P9Z8_9NOCA|nr:polyprenyl synthetase family protein [Nocardia transvalensis]MBB5912162.1 geranylgeranyl diphosphate synthase type I [Nocardia transvalensis]
MSVAADIVSVRDVRNEMMKRAETAALEFLEKEYKRWYAVDPEAGATIESIADLMRAGGKRVRPEFCLSGYLAAGGDPEGHAIVSAAVALEFLHASALIHDDVFDESAVRRGAPTVHVKYSELHRSRGWQGESPRFGESVAVLAGDLALVYADIFMADAMPAATAAWGDVRAELMVGQHLDVVAAARYSGNPRLSRTIAQLKSGNYTIHRPLLIGALVAGRSDLSAPFEAYGLAVGEAFQLRDDLLDMFGDTDTLGKPAQLDLERHKMTLVLSLAIERDPAVRALIDAPDAAPARLQQALLDSDTAREVEKHIGELVARGGAALADADLEPGWHEELLALADAVAYRDK